MPREQPRTVMFRGAMAGLTVWMLGMLAANPVQAAFIDPLDTAANFNAGFGGTTAVANGDSTVNLTRNTPSVDAGIDWLIGGVTKIPLNAGHNQLDVLPVAPVNGGFYSISLLFFDNTDTFISEVGWLADSQDTSTQTIPDLSAFAAANSVVDADSWFLRFRIQPFDQTGAAFQFTQIQAVPEPASWSLGALALIALLRRRRRSSVAQG